ncbi:ribonuclease III [bacterium]|nr:MAG: ribonuclease III [bacterium]
MIMKIFRPKNEIEKAIGYKFSNSELLIRAITSPSSAERHKDSYQRLEFLGDAVLDFIVSKWLFLHYPDANEGTLTEFRRILVNRTALANVAKNLKLNEYIDYEIDDENYVGNSLLCDIYEAIVAAIFLDGGIKYATKFVSDTLLKYTDKFFSSPKFVNYKGELLELLQSVGNHPRYVVLETTGPDHCPKFRVGVYNGNKLLGVGVGLNKKTAEQQAAKKALEKLNKSI